MNKNRYLIQSASHWLLRRRLECPACGRRSSRVLERKGLVTALRRCANCLLLFRTPTTSQEESDQFYQEEYSEGFTTDTPAETELLRMLETGFAGSAKDYRTYLGVLKALGGLQVGSALLDYGSSWGYGTWQIRQAGYTATAFEVSKRRARYAEERLGLRAYSDPAELYGPYDWLFSSHVLEHVPSLRDLFVTANRLLRIGGLFVGFTPNASDDCFTANPQRRHSLWGKVHPQLIDGRFVEANFRDSPCLVASSPYDLEAIRSWSQKDFCRLDLSGEELLVVLRSPFAAARFARER